MKPVLTGRACYKNHAHHDAGKQNAPDSPRRPYHGLALRKLSKEIDDREKRQEQRPQEAPPSSQPLQLRGDIIRSVNAVAQSCFFFQIGSDGLD